MKDLGDLPGGEDISVAVDVNNAGQVVGYSTAATGYRAFLWDSVNGMQDLGVLPGGPDYSVAYAIADSPFGPFKRVGKILKQDPAIATGAGHHSILNPPGSDAWYIVYHRRPLKETDRNAREVCIDKMVFDKNGFIQPVTITNEGVRENALGIKK